MKQSVAVVALHGKSGEVTPLFVVGDNRVKYAVDRIIRKQRAASLKSGGQGIRYTVRIRNQLRYLYYENPGWFIEKIDF